MNNLNSSACSDSKVAKSSVLRVCLVTVFTNCLSRDGASTASKAETSFNYEDHYSYDNALHTS